MSFIKRIFGMGSENEQHSDDSAKLAALNAVQPMIECDLNSHIVHANQAFLKLGEWSLNDIAGQGLSVFLTVEENTAPDFESMLVRVRKGEHPAGKGILCLHNNERLCVNTVVGPLYRGSGEIYGFIVCVNDISRYDYELNEKAAMLAAIDKTQAMIEFSPDGVVLNANDNFLEVMGYSRDEVIGKHHRLFLTSEYAESAEYREFWRRLRSGEFVSEEFNRLAKGGREVWLQAIYNPVKDKHGQVIKVVKFAYDVSQKKQSQLEAKRLANISNALMLCQANVMLADSDLNIIYLNNRVRDMLKAREKEIQKKFPSFKVDELIGKNVDIFHERPAHQRTLLSEQTEPYKATIGIETLSFDLVATPWLNLEGDRIGTVVEWADITDELARLEREQQLANENARVRQALDNVTANVMIADTKGNIIYTNNAVLDMLKNAEEDIRKALPKFSSKNLIGQNFDQFHKNPSHQQQLLSQLNSTYFGKAEVGGRSFTVIANPVFQEGERVGSVVEWSDKTSELEIEREIDSIVSAVSQGDFSRQVQVEGKHGFSLVLAEGLNRLTSTVEVALNDVLRMLGAMARGDLSERITREYTGSFGELKAHANGTADKLTEVISKIRIASNSISIAANEIAQGNADLSQRTEEQASSLEQTASSMEQMTSTVKQSEENAQLASARAMEAQQKAREGGEVVERAVNAMSGINAASKKISDIIGVIDEIAFQTNLLALNAAVEAARAGDQGRGFAVVAGEVRNLAQRSAGAAREIKDLIRDTANKVEDGTRLVNQSGKTLADIVDAVENVTVMMGDIASAAREQTSGIEQVNAAITQMDEMTQKNAALVEEATAAGESMADQARDMSAVVSFFSSVGTHSDSTRAVPAPVRNTTVRNTTVRKTTALNAAKPMHNKAADNTSAPYRSVENTSVTNKSTQKKPLSMPKTPVAKVSHEDLDDEWEDF